MFCFLSCDAQQLLSRWVSFRDFQRFQLETAGNAVRYVSLISCWLFPSDVLLSIHYLTWAEPPTTLFHQGRHSHRDKEFPHGTKLASRYWYDCSLFFLKRVSAHISSAWECYWTAAYYWWIVHPRNCLDEFGDWTGFGESFHHFLLGNIGDLNHANWRTQAPPGHQPVITVITSVV
jgi:hypothetical protein